MPTSVIAGSSDNSLFNCQNDFRVAVPCFILLPMDVQHHFPSTIYWRKKKKKAPCVWGLLTTKLQWFTGWPHKTQQQVLLTAKVNYSKGYRPKVIGKIYALGRVQRGHQNHLKPHGLGGQVWNNFAQGSLFMTRDLQLSCRGTAPSWQSGGMGYIGKGLTFSLSES